MQLQSRFLSSSVFAALWVGCFALILTGCDSSGSSDSDDTETFDVTVKNVGAPSPLLKSGVFNTPVNSNEAGPIGPGEAYEVTFTAGTNELPGTGAAFSFGTMFIQSNDMFYAFKPGGLSLFDSNGDPVSGDVTPQVYMWDAGTEEDQAPGAGSNQPMQGGTESGPDDSNNTLQVTSNDQGNLEDNGYVYPDVSEVINVTVNSTKDAESGGYEFTVRIENVSDDVTVNGKDIPLSPGSWGVHFDTMPGDDDTDVTYPSFAEGTDATGTGIEDIAEDGKPGVHAETLDGKTGVTVPFSPGAYAVHSDEVSFFNTGSSASAGIEDIAEDGKPGNLVSTLQDSDGIQSVGAFNTPEGSDSKGPLTPGNSYTFSVDAEPGDRLSLATMYIQSNDLFYAFPSDGIALFEDDDTPVGGDVTSTVMLYDAGTEGDQEPGVGLDQAPRQSDLDTGPSEEGTVTQVDGSDDGFSYPSTGSLVEVTIDPPSTQ